MPQKEQMRLQAVNRFLKLELSKEKELQEIVELAASICGTPIALITLLDQDKQHLLFKHGIEVESTPRQHAFCNHVIEHASLVVVPDATADERFFRNPLVTGDPNIRFYAGAPLSTGDGQMLGSLCVIDRVPGQLSAIQQQMLYALSKQAMQLMEFDASLEILKQQYADARRAEIELRAFFESSIDCHLLLGKEFEVLAFNKAWESYVKVVYDLQLERGKLMTCYLHPENVEHFYRDYSKALKGTAVFAERKVRHGERYVWRIIKFEPAFDENGIIIGVAVNSTDITKNVEHEATVLAQNQSLQEIAFIQSHELRRPVASILGLMEILRNEGYTQSIEELQLMDKAVEELDQKIRLVVGYTNMHDTRI